MTLDGAGPHAPLGVYIHWPYCARICPYCDFNVTRDRGRSSEARALVAAIAQDLKAHAERMAPAELVSIYFGGGTPSLAPPDATAELIALAKSLWMPAAMVEITLEANPTDAETARLALFAEAGVNRLSLGVQALDDPALAFLKRNHDAAQARRAVQAALRAFPQVSLDLIYALPGQSVREWAAALGEAAALGTQHVSAYQLGVEPRTPFGRQVAQGRWAPPGPDAGADLYATTQAVLEAAGFDAYEVSNHARGLEARSRHNLVYWRGEAYVGVGPGAHGRPRLDGVRTATRAEADVEAYVARVCERGVGWVMAEPLGATEALEERVLMGLRTDEGVARADLARLGREAALAPLVEGGWLLAEGERVRATPAGRLLLDRVAGELLA